ncbi:MAG: hypothetical protein L0Y54_00070 [Sporichthyaceae bacterium]|nr:hypothetical protein [Sporichthyaceae bacterium]
MVCSFALLAMAVGCTTANPNGAALPTASASETPAATSAEVTPSPSPIVATLGSLTGAWKGTWTNTSPQTAVGTFVLTWAQQGNLVFGAIGVTGSNCLDAGNVTGNIDGSKISFGAVEGDTEIFYEGIISGTIMTGTYRSDCGNSSGTWTAVKA